MDQYEDLHELNSSVCEQYHSFLASIRGMVKHMRLDHFMVVLRLFVNIWNAEKLAAAIEL